MADDAPEAVVLEDEEDPGIQDMDQYLQHFIAVERQNTRIRLIDNVFESFEALVGKDDKLASDACSVSRKQGGREADKHEGWRVAY